MSGQMRSQGVARFIRWQIKCPHCEKFITQEVELPQVRITAEQSQQEEVNK